MHPRKRLLKIIRRTEQLLADEEWWNSHRSDAEPFDLGAERVMLALATDALSAWDRRDTARFNELIARIHDHAVTCQREFIEEESS